MSRKSEEFERPILTVDIVLFTIKPGDGLHVLMPRRDRAPFGGLRSLVGGYIRTNEDKDTHAAAVRILRDKVSIEVPYLEQLAMFSGAERDPRGWSATMAYISMVPWDEALSALADDFIHVDDVLSDHFDTGFDHKIIVKWAVERLRNKTGYSSLPLLLMPNEFTLHELQMMYQEMMGCPIKKETFRHKMQESGMIEATGGMSDPEVTNTRPAKLFRSKLRSIQFFKSEIDR